MRAITLIATALAVTGLAATPALAQTQTQTQTQTQVFGTRPGSTVRAPLTAEEMATLQWMREEEKVARDVYMELYAFWPNKIFKSIAKQEQAHFASMGKMLRLFNVPDPALPNVGDFSSPELQAMHDELLARGMVSFVEALRVGVEVETTDIADLEAALAETSRAPLVQNYRHLLLGSRVHLRRFEELLRTLGATTAP